MAEIQPAAQEQGKPNPVSLHEYQLMDRHEQKAFLDGLTRDEQKMFQKTVAAKVYAQTRQQWRETARAFVKKLEGRDNKTIGDKLELQIARVRAAQLSLPEKKPIFFRKLRTGKPAVPKFLLSAKSPYLIA